MTRYHAKQSWPATCSYCKQKLSKAQWERLEYVGTMGAEGEWIEMRNHDCTPPGESKATTSVYVLSGERLMARERSQDEQEKMKHFGVAIAQALHITEILTTVVSLVYNNQPEWVVSDWEGPASCGFGDLKDCQRQTQRLEASVSFTATRWIDDEPVDVTFDFQVARHPTKHVLAVLAVSTCWSRTRDGRAQHTRKWCGTPEEAVDYAADRNERFFVREAARLAAFERREKADLGLSPKRKKRRTKRRTWGKGMRR